MLKERWTSGLCVLVMVALLPLPVRALSRDADGSTVTIEALVEPVRWSEMQFLVSGQVAQVPVSAGDTVTAGEVLVQLNDQQAALSVQEAEAAVATARANLAVVRAGPRIQEIAAATAALDAANGDLWQAVALRDQIAAGSAQAAATAAQAQLEAARAERRVAQQALDWADEDKTRERTAREQLHVAELEIAAAEARVAAAPAASAAQLREANAGVWATQAQVAVAEAQLALVEAGARAEEIAIAQAEVQQIELALAMAQLDLERTTLRAPFAGTVTQVYVEPGDSIASGMVVVVLATLDHLHLQSTDLTELDVVHVVEGQRVATRVDALPGVTLSAVVRAVALEPGAHHGDVVYTAILDFGQEIDPRLRWGMTAHVDIALP